MLTQSDIQRILDHYHVGKVIEFIQYDFYVAAQTNQGTFYVLSDEPATARATEVARREALVREVGSVDRQQLANYKGQLSDDASYAHYQHKYYSVYKSIGRQH